MSDPAAAPPPKHPAPGDGWPIDDLGPEAPLASRILDALRIGAVLLAVGIVTLIGIPLQWAALTLKMDARRRIPALYHRILLKLIGVKLEVRGAPASGRPLLILSNHSSWLDIPVIGALGPLVFVAKSEVGGWPVIGLLARLQRTVFVDRQRRQATGDVNKEIAGRLAEGDPVVLFAEGTSSDGNRVLAFRTALVGAAREALADGQDVLVQPLSVAYVRIQGVPMGRAHRRIAAWYGDMDLAPHLMAVLRQGAVDAVVTFGEPRALDAAHDRKDVTRACEDEVRAMSADALAGNRRP